MWIMRYGGRLKLKPFLTKEIPKITQNLIPNKEEKKKKYLKILEINVVKI